MTITKEEIKKGLILVIDGLIAEAESTKKLIETEKEMSKPILKDNYKTKIIRIDGLLRDMAREYLSPQEYRKLEDKYIELKEGKI